MFRKQDFKKVDLLGSGKKNTKIFKAEHIPSGKYFAIKEIEAKTIDKLNEYKEEAVQLCKIKNHPNIIQTYNYYFYETQVNTFRIAIVWELMDESLNLERIFRKRQQKGSYWKEEELEKIIVSLISTLSFLQSIGICHRDIKPSNLFLMDNGEIKVIDFGESKDYFWDTDDGGAGTLATIRGTPQYLSPLLWKAYVVEKNTRHATHNIYKSDVFSWGLVFIQIASMEDVTNFNNLSEGEELVDKGLKKLRKRYSEHICEILRLMLKFEESERPSFIELAKLVLTSEDNTLVSPKEEIKDNRKEDEVIETNKIGSSLGLPKHRQSAELPSSPQNIQPMLHSDLDSLPKEHHSSSNYMTQADLFKNYVEANKLYVTFGSLMYWFEAAGKKIGKVELHSDPDAEEPNPWKLVGKFHYDFYSHVVVVPTNEQHVYYILGGVKENWFLF